MKPLRKDANFLINLKISVFVKPHSSKPSVQIMPDGSYVVKVHARPHDGEANEAVIEALAASMRRPKNSMKIVSGLSSRKKIIEIN